MGNFGNGRLGDMDGKLNDFYGHLYSEKILVGGQLFIKDFNTTQIHFLKTHLNWIYNLVKYDEPKIETWDGKEITRLVFFIKSFIIRNVLKEHFFSYLL